MSHSSAAANGLLNTIQSFADKQTNPLQYLLDSLSLDHFHVETKYPESRLIFAGDQWGAFFHVHADQRLFPDEYGHFHIFVRTMEAKDWTHVIALSMDAYGQPNYWFTTNHWVTSGVWLNAEQMESIIEKQLVAEDSANLLQNWLYSMIRFYRERIIDLLYERDAIVSKEDAAKFLRDRTRYMLSYASIDLLEDLKKLVNLKTL